MHNTVIKYNSTQSSSQFVFCFGFGPPAGLAIIIWSILSTVIAASLANLNAHKTVIKWSHTPNSFDDLTSPLSTSIPDGPLALYDE